MNLWKWAPVVRQVRVTNILLAARLRAERRRRADPPSFAAFFKRRESAATVNAGATTPNQGKAESAQDPSASSVVTP